MVTFSEVSWEAETLDREMRSRDCRACHAVPPTVAAAAMVVDLEKWKETKRAELRQEMKEQMTALMETLVREVRQNVPPEVPAGVLPNKRQPEEALPEPDWHNYTWYPVRVPMALPPVEPAAPLGGQDVGGEEDVPLDREEGEPQKGEPTTP
ncbi:hypothetical protein NHX12_001190 [Muraenolepis orangiensis]|uniref:Uncharacterized protein n=1 Tax=Muraenolepis orangiensis TaxID=630683 RepID=A0A9Q0IH14_9TELE|nr:hypothetical protein NHX12_001190 [Muraenolepis orangiensis]